MGKVPETKDILLTQALYPFVEISFTHLEGRGLPLEWQGLDCLPGGAFIGREPGLNMRCRQPRWCLLSALE